jgi:hypothetical protein
MLQFAGNRELEAIKNDVLKAGGAWNTERYDAGDDRLSFTFKDRLVIYCPLNGRFIAQKGLKGKAAEELVTESSVEMEKHQWYVDLLNLLYKPLKKSAA